MEESKVTEHRWLGPGDLGVMRENRLEGDCTLYHLVQRARDITSPATPPAKNV